MSTCWFNLPLLARGEIGLLPARNAFCWGPLRYHWLARLVLLIRRASGFTHSGLNRLFCPQDQQGKVIKCFSGITMLVHRVVNTARNAICIVYTQVFHQAAHPFTPV